MRCTTTRSLISLALFLLLAASSCFITFPTSRASAASTTLVADYKFQTTRATSAGPAPDLVDLLPSGGAAPNSFETDFVRGPQTVLRYPAGNGLKMQNSAQLLQESYTILLSVKFDNVMTTSRILDFTNGMSDAGWYVSGGRIQLRLERGGVQGATPVRAGEYTQLAFTRAADGTYDLYINGTHVFTGTDRTQELVVTQNGLRFFQDNTAGSNTGENGSGRIARLRIYDGALGGEEIGALLLRHNGKVLFAREGGAAVRGIWTVNPDGTEAVPVLVNAPQIGEGFAVQATPRWSPDGKRIVYAGHESTKEGLYVVNADGTHNAPFPGADAGADWPAWSPDGSQLAYHCGSFVCVINVDGTKRRKVNQVPFDAPQGIDWSPDGTKLVFSNASGTDATKTGIFRINVDGTGLVQLTDDATAREPRWSPDGTRIAFTSNRTLPDNPFPSPRIWTMDADGFSPTLLITEPAFSYNAPAWSPDGSRLAYTSLGTDGPQNHLYTADSTGAHLSLLYWAGDNLDEFSPDWQSLEEPPPATNEEHTISGRITTARGDAVAHVTVNLINRRDASRVSTETDGDGRYSFQGAAGALYSIKPEKTGYVFSPSEARPANLNADATVNFTAIPPTFVIEGTLSDAAGEPLSGVTVSLTGTENALVATDSDGYYAFTGLAIGGSYSVTPASEALTFNPVSRSVNDINNNFRFDFTGTLKATPTPTPTPTPESSPTPTPTSTPDATPTPESSPSPSPESSPSPEPSPSPEATTSVIGFSAESYAVDESDPSGVATITVTRTGDVSLPASVDYATSDASGLVPCQSDSHGIASERCDYITAIGTLRFAAGETQKTIQILIINDAYVEQPESFNITLANAQGSDEGSTAATVTITSDDTQPATVNPIDDQGFFIKEQYVDFLGRMPEPAGFQFWMNRMTNCPAGDTCDRTDTSQRFFQSDEFQERGFYVYRLYDAALGRLPRYVEFVADTARLSGNQTVEEQHASKQSYLRDFVARAEFRSLYGQYLSEDGRAVTDAEGFVKALSARAGLTPSDGDARLQEAESGDVEPARILEDFILQPELANQGTRFYDRGLIAMQYFGYLRRDPDEAGFRFWEAQLIGEDAPHRGDYRFMVGGFINSDEYRFRFAELPLAP